MQRSAINQSAFTRLLIALLFLLAIHGSSSASEPDLSDIPNLTIQYYQLDGMTEKKMRAQMDEAGPVDPNDHKRVDAVTLWNFRWGWTGFGSADCELSSAFVRYKIKMVLPHATKEAQFAVGLAAKWEAFLRAMIGHERVHARFVVQEAPHVLAAIKSASCLTGDSAAHRVLEVITQHDVGYDAVTEHGATQGVRFP